MIRQLYKLLSTCFLALLIFISSAFASDSDKPTPRGSIHGKVVEALTLSPVVGASVIVVGTQTGAATDADGKYKIANLDAGTYAISVRSVAHKPTAKSDIVVRPGRITFVNVELNQTTIEIEGTTVHAGYFTKKPGQPTSTTDFSGEEIRRSPGSAGDVSRIIATLPCIAKVNDQLNSLIVRGGTPTENGFYVDNIMIPNINHYPLQGSSGGPIGLLNVDFINDVSFSAGGFSPIYGDRLSSIMDIKFREGNREEFEAQLDLGFAGAGLTAEGPLFDGKGSWMLSVRRSYLDLLVDAIGTGVAPKFSDYQGKLVYDIGRSDQINILGILGIDFIDFKKEQSLEDGNNFYGTYEGHEYSVGLNWRHLWGKAGHSNTSVSFLGTRFLSNFYWTESDINLTREDNIEQIAQFRNVNTLLLGEQDHIDFGIEASSYINDYDVHVNEHTNQLGDPLPALDLVLKEDAPKVGTFINLSLSPLPKLTLTGGARFDYFDYNQQSHVSPRFALSYRFTNRTSINASVGIFYQNLPLGLLMMHENNRNLSDPQSHHYVLGFSHLLSENTRLTVEGYLKNYFNFPIDPNQPQLFVVDEMITRGFFGNYEDLLDIGKARSYGLEMTLQKKLVEGIYGLASGSWFKSQYKDLEETWRDRVIDNRFLFALEGGYQPNNKYAYSIRWIFAGGAPFSPLDLEKSRLINRSVIDENRINEERYPTYHSLNIRFEHRYLFKKSSLVAYISIWNVYNRKNVASYYWNMYEQDEDVLYQWSILPVGGFEWEF